MSNFLAVAAVTATLAQRIQSTVAHDVPGANVTVVRPDSVPRPPTGPGVNIFLYQVTPNVGWRNQRLPTLDSDGRLAGRPTVAFNLHYILTFYGNEGNLEPQRLLGSVTRTLNGRAVLTRTLIRRTIADPAYNYLAASNLADDVELVKISQLPLSLEELSKLWSVFFQTPYNLSVAYECSVVLIETDDEPHTALPVLDRNVYVVPFRQPVIDRIVSSSGQEGHLQIGETLELHVRNVQGDQVLIRIGGIEVKPSEVAEGRLSLLLQPPKVPLDILQCGVQGVQVVQRLSMGSPSAPHCGFESAVVPFILHPNITLPAGALQVQGSIDGLYSGTLTIAVCPNVRRTQRAVLSLDEVIGSKPGIHVFPAPPRTADTDTIIFSVSGLKAADYLVRIRIDGAENRLERDTHPANQTFNEYIAPKVTIP